MPRTFEIDSPEQGAQLMARLARAGEHAPLPVPHELRKRGIRGITSSIRGSEFRLLLATRSEWATTYAIRGRVESLPDRGSRIVAWMEQDSRPVVSLLVLGALAVWLLVSGSAWGWAVLGFAALLFVLDSLDNDRVTPEKDVETRFLYESLLHIVNAGNGSGKAGDPERLHDR